MAIFTISVYYVWQWEDEKGNMNPYGVKNTLELETAHKQMKDSITIEACSRSYSVDIQNMEQKNTVTDVIRKVFREQSSRF
jgi:hypothetical protein